MLWPNDPALSVRVRRIDPDEAWAELIRLMREASAALQPSADYEQILAAHRERLAFMESRMRAELPERLRNLRDT